MSDRTKQRTVVPQPQWAGPDPATVLASALRPPAQGTESAARVWRGVPREQRVRQRRLVMLDAGLEVFGTVGVRGATVAGVCRQAQLTQRYFYESFPSLRSLLAEVFTHVTELQHKRIIEAALGARARGETQRQSIRAGLDVYFRSLQEDPRLARLQLMEVLGSGDEVTERCHQMAIRRAADLLVSGLQEAPGLAVPQLIAVGLIGAAVEIAAMWFLADFAEPLDAVVGSAYVIIDAVIAADRTAPPQRAARRPSSNQGGGRPDRLAAPARPR